MKFAIAMSLAGLSLVFTSPALAHVAPGETGGLIAGLAHPVLGMDHLLALLAMGLWSASLAARARLLAAGGIGLLLAASALAGISGLVLPYMETGIALSVLILGLMLSFAFRQPASGLILIALFTLFHGNAHGVEAPSNLSLPAYFLGFILASLGLVSAGQWLGRALSQGLAVRLSGGLLAMTGTWLLLG
jgi:urease accessory protein